VSKFTGTRGSKWELADYAVEYAYFYGFAVFPCKPRSKLPATKHGFKDATKSRSQIVKWWSQCPEYNIGIATGVVSGLYVIDVDPRNGGKISDVRDVPGSWPIITGGGGWHLYCPLPKNMLIRSKSNWLPGIDMKAEGGYVIAPPSIHPSGERYDFKDAWAVPDMWGNGVTVQEAASW